MFGVKRYVKKYIYPNLVIRILLIYGPILQSFFHLSLVYFHIPSTKHKLMEYCIFIFLLAATKPKHYAIQK